MHCRQKCHDNLIEKRSIDVLGDVVIVVHLLQHRGCENMRWLIDCVVVGADFFTAIPARWRVATMQLRAVQLVRV